jgi:hypothetical protein
MLFLNMVCMTVGLSPGRNGVSVFDRPRDIATFPVASTEPRRRRQGEGRLPGLRRRIGGRAGRTCCLGGFQDQG